MRRNWFYLCFTFYFEIIVKITEKFQKSYKDLPIVSTLIYQLFIFCHICSLIPSFCLYDYIIIKPLKTMWQTSCLFIPKNYVFSENQDFFSYGVIFKTRKFNIVLHYYPFYIPYWNFHCPNNVLYYNLQLVYLFSLL